MLYTQLGKDDLEGFLKEAQTIAHLEHPHIVRVTDFGLDGDLPYLVMEYAPTARCAIATHAIARYPFP